MSTKRSNLIEFNVYLGKDLHTRLQTLQEAGLSMSAVARLAVRKCAGMSLDDVIAGSTNRVSLYLHPDDASMLDQVTDREGERSKGKVLRRLISTYLRINSAAIEAMF